jgi:hypothetical protein
MNRYARGPAIGGPSKATASTTCQKCLKKDTFTSVYDSIQNSDDWLRHYSYECKAVVQERPYVTRPSRTQQLMNPKLLPKLMSDVPQDLLRKYVSAALLLCLFWISMLLATVYRAKQTMQLFHCQC